jgi:hypothetical protein
MMVSFRNFQRIHLVGIGGIGMSGIAEVLQSRNTCKISAPRSTTATGPATSLTPMWW